MKSKNKLFGMGELWNVILCGMRKIFTTEILDWMWRRRGEVVCYQGMSISESREPRALWKAFIVLKRAQSVSSDSALGMVMRAGDAETPSHGRVTHLSISSHQHMLQVKCSFAKPMIFGGLSGQ